MIIIFLYPYSLSIYEIYFKKKPSNASSKVKSLIMGVFVTAAAGEGVRTGRDT